MSSFFFSGTLTKWRCKISIEMRTLKKNYKVLLHSFCGSYLATQGLFLLPSDALLLLRSRWGQSSQQLLISPQDPRVEITRPGHHSSWRVTTQQLTCWQRRRSTPSEVWSLPRPSLLLQRGASSGRGQSPSWPPARWSPRTPPQPSWWRSGLLQADWSKYLGWYDEGSLSALTYPGRSSVVWSCHWSSNSLLAAM